MKLCDGVFQRRDEAIVNSGLHQDAIGADAGLSGVAEFRCHRAGDGLREIGVVEDDHRRVAAEFKRQLF